MLEFANNFGKGLIYKGLDSALSLRPLFSGKQSVGMVLCHCDHVLVGSNLLEWYFVIATTLFSGKQSVGNGALSLRPLFSGKQSVGMTK